MKEKFSNRINQVPRSFIRDILKVASAPNMISFAGELPNPRYFPVNEIKESTNRVLTKNPTMALQYGLTQGLPELRQQIANYYKSQQIDVAINQIIITTGSQQALDLIGKVFINESDNICLEEPSYLGAIQAFSMYSGNFNTVPLIESGIDTNKYEQTIKQHKPKFSYLIPNFQNPTGLTYTLETRKKVAAIAKETNSIIVEDDPYGRINITNESFPNIYKYAPDNTILLGSFSKILAPGFRLGWIIAKEEIIQKLELTKQASDLHTNALCQSIASDYLQYNDPQEHINKITKAYKTQAEAICNAMKLFFPSETKYVEPKGGMFTWVTLPKNISSLDLFEKAKRKKVAFVPGVPFFINKQDSNCLRLNFSCLEPEIIEKGIRTISKLI